MNLPITYKELNTAVERFMSGKTIAERRKRFEDMEQALFTLPQLSEDAYELEESFSGGLYCRKIRIPQGALITGRVYKQDHIEVMISGDISILSADGGCNRYEGYKVIEAKAGKRQAGFAHEDTVWMTINRVPSHIPEEHRLDYCAVESYGEYQAFFSKVNQLDYVKFLNEIGLTEDQMAEIVNVDDVVDMDYSHIYTKESPIHGVGLFAKRDFSEGDVICPARLGENRTIAGRYTNHALRPNTGLMMKGGEPHIVAAAYIPAGEEITMNYRDVLLFRQQERIE